MIKTEGMLTYRNTVEYSGNSTIHIIILNSEYEINAIREIFEDMKCPSERYDDAYFALEIPFYVDYLPIKQKLAEMEEAEIISYAETSLSENHYYE